MSFSHFARSGNFHSAGMSKETEAWCHHLEKHHKFANAIKPKEYKVASVATAHGTLSRLS